MGRRGPKAKVSDEVKQTVTLLFKKFSVNESQKELVFPSSLTSEERKYIHQMAHHAGFQTKSRGKASNRYLTLYKKEGSNIISRDAIVGLCEGSQTIIIKLLHRWPVTNKERQDLIPPLEKERIVNAELKELTLNRSVGRLTPGPPVVPPRRSHSDVFSDARKLPVWDLKEQVMAAIKNNQVTLIRGETGCGKTTQVPQMILESACSEGKPCKIVCTQPRRISAISITERVAAERGERVGYTVGYQIRLEGKLSPKTLLVFCTTGVLLRTLMGGEASLNTVTHVIVDEVHERDKFNDFVLTIMKDLLPKFRQLKLILMSANLDSNFFVKYFNGCPVVDIPGRTHPVKTFFLEDVLKFTKYTNKKMEKALKTLKKGTANSEVGEWSKVMMERVDLRDKKKSEEPEESKETSNEVGTVAAVADVESTVQMDECLEKAFKTGEDEHFSQMMYLILSENVDIDYQHSSTFATPLMVSAGRGRLDTLEILLSMGARINLRSANDWTAMDFAESTHHEQVVELLKAYSVFEEVSNLQLDPIGKLSQSSAASEEDVHLLKAYNLSRSNEFVDTDLIFSLCLKIHKELPPGGILVFLPGYDSILTLRDFIEDDDDFNATGRVSVYYLHSNMQSTDQKKVFRPAPAGVRKIVLATNIAETSITINDIVYVVDCGSVKETSYDSLSGASCLRPVLISQASAAQRRGRAGRCKPGVCYHLFSKAVYGTLQVNITPEILRMPLQDICLHTKLLAAPNVLIADFLAKAPEPPSFMAVKNAVQTLKCMDALDAWEDVTELGHHLLELPLPPHLGKMVIFATFLKCLDPILTIVSCMSYKDPFILPHEKKLQSEIKQIKVSFANQTFSDHMVLLKAYQGWLKAKHENWGRKFCNRHFLSPATMEMIHGTRMQVLTQLRNSGFIKQRGPGDLKDVNTHSENWAIVKCALISGYYPNLIRVDRERLQFKTEKHSKVSIHSSSVLNEVCPSDSRGQAGDSRKALPGRVPTDWLIFDEMTRTASMEENGHVAPGVQVKCVTLVSPLSVLMMAGPSRVRPERIPLLGECGVPGKDSRLHMGMLQGESSSDSESEDKATGFDANIKIDEWIHFICEGPISQLCMELRCKLHSMILRRLRAPSKLIPVNDEDVVRVFAGILHQEDLFLGLSLPQAAPLCSNFSTAQFNQPPPLMNNRSITYPAIPLPTESSVGEFENDLYTKPSGNKNFGDFSNNPNKKQTSIKKNVQNQQQQLNSKTNGAVKKETVPVVTQANASSTLLAGLNVSTANDSEQATAVNVASKSSNIKIASRPLNSSANNKPSSSTKENNIKPNSKGTAKGKAKETRYFILRGQSAKQIEISQQKGAWALPVGTEKKILQATQNGPVELIFALNRSNQFNGYATFTGQKSNEKSPELSYYGHPPVNLYKVDWVMKQPIPFHQTKHLLNPYTDNLQVHMCRDGQEVEPSVGKQLVTMWHHKNGPIRQQPLFDVPHQYPPPWEHQVHGYGNAYYGGQPKYLLPSQRPTKGQLGHPRR